jgi:hypothetical protein
MKNVTSMLKSNHVRLIVIVVLLAVAALGAYRFAGGRNAEAEAASGTVATATSAAAPAATPASDPVTAAAATSSTVTTEASASGGSPGGGGCCALRGSSTPVEGEAQVAGSVQKVSVDVSSGSYNPNVIKLKAGIPAEITFSQSSGCIAIVQSDDLGFQADLSTGPKTVKLAGLDPGTYGFACGMYMVTGQIIVE